MFRRERMWDVDQNITVAPAKATSSCPIMRDVDKTGDNNPGISLWISR